jgi:glycosyltransferase involved in cell wall biosynthesis
VAKIVTVYTSRRFQLVDMSYIRWFKISEGLARHGHQVHMAMSQLSAWWARRSAIRMAADVQQVRLSHIRWSDYDVVKTLFHEGFDLLTRHGGLDHPFIISELGSVVGPEDRAGIYFYGRTRERLFATQRKISEKSKYVALLSRPAQELWKECFAATDNVLIVPGGVDREVPPPLQNPYSEGQRARCLFAGNVYDRRSQPEANTVLIDKLNRLGKLLSQRGIQLYLLGPGDVRQLDKRWVSYLGAVPYQEAWDYLRFADVGVVVAAGEFMHNNESSKIYYYLRVGLPVVCEAGFPNEHVVTESHLGFVVENGNLELMARRVEAAVHADWDREYAINYILGHHTWDRRVEVYDKVIRQCFRQ